MTVLQIHHVQLAMPEGGEAEARSFYEGALGLREIPKPPHLAVRGGCWFEREGVKVHLGVEDDFRPARKAHPAFVVYDLKAVADRIARLGYRLVEDQPLAGYDRVYVDDPFGNRIELMQPRPDVSRSRAS